MSVFPSSLRELNGFYTLKYWPTVVAEQYSEGKNKLWWPKKKKILYLKYLRIEALPILRWSSSDTPKYLFS